MIKRKTIIGLLSLLALAGCSEGGAVAPASETAIAFSTDLPDREVVTRSTTPLEETATSFKVWAYKNTAKDGGSFTASQTVMDGYNVRWAAGTANTTITNRYDWEYILLACPSQTVKFWDFSAKAYRFFAVAPDNAGSSTRNTAGDDGHYSGDHIDVTLFADATNPEDAPYFSLLWFSDDTEDYGKPVVLEFQKPFAKVRFMFTWTTPDGMPDPVLEDPDFRPATAGQRIATAGSVTISVPITGTGTEELWNSVPDWDTYLISFTRPFVTSVDEYYETVLPVRGQGAYMLTVTVNGEDKTCMVPAEYMEWLPGYKYTYLFRVNDEGGVVLDMVHEGVKDWNWDSFKDVANRNLYNW